VPAAPIQRVDQVLADEQVRYRAMVSEMDHPVHGRVPTLGTPLKVDGAMSLDVTPPARLGQHTDDVLRDVAGYDAARIEALRRTGVIR
jgi:crotonobetainyl-CoA:carnitine CoA-transferase CaiB-like acyl-CoA transferase